MPTELLAELLFDKNASRVLLNSDVASTDDSFNCKQQIEILFSIIDDMLVYGVHLNNQLLLHKDSKFRGSGSRVLLESWGLQTALLPILVLLMELVERALVPLRRCTDMGREAKRAEHQ